MTKRKKSLVEKMAKERVLPHIIPPQMEKPPYSLSGADLLVYADLWAYSRVNPFIGSYQDLANWIGVPKTSVMRSVKELGKRGLVEVININAHKTSFQAKAIPGAPLPVYRFYVAGYTDNNEPLVAQKMTEITQGGQRTIQNGPRLNQFGPRSDQNGPYQYNIYNTNSKNKTYKRENFDNSSINTLEHALAIEEQMRAENRRLREQHDKEASTPEALAAGEAFFEKFFKSG